MAVHLKASDIIKMTVHINLSKWLVGDIYIGLSSGLENLIFMKFFKKKFSYSIDCILFFTQWTLNVSFIKTFNPIVPILDIQHCNILNINFMKYNWLRFFFFFYVYVPSRRRWSLPPTSSSLLSILILCLLFFSPKDFSSVHLLIK